ncbi:MAG: ABC transporter ATP-binding protein, partial [Oscillochloris sp.]|nr:ABC transporter ATP-binding protein [Oscillochloris sp.]
IEAALRAAGVEDAHVELIDPSLEDVFVTLVGRHAAGE